jgi:uncharacterized protein (DUF736 family)
VVESGEVGHNGSVKRLALAVVAGLALTGAGSAATSAPSIRVVARAPLVVAGANFKPGEIVTVTVIAHRAAVPIRRRATSRGGSFRLRFPAVAIGDCDAYGIRAVGNRGSAATYRPPRLMCGTEPQPVDG